MPRRRPYVAPVGEKEIGRRLRELHEQRGMTHAQIAKTLGIEQTLVSDHERGELRLHGALVAGFAKALRVSADMILGLEELKTNGLVKDRRFLRRLTKIDKLSARQRQSLLTMIDNSLKASGLD